MIDNQNHLERFRKKYSPVNAAARKERPAALPCGKAAKISTNTADLNAIESFMLFTLSKIARARSRSSIFVIPFPSTSQSPPFIVL